MWTNWRRQKGEAMDSAAQVCKNCKWFAEETEVCVNDQSDHLADFVMPDDVCDEWEGNDDNVS